MRRIRVNQVSVGDTALSSAEAHHARDVLRLAVGTEVEVFDDEGRTGHGILTQCEPDQVMVQVRQVRQAPQRPLAWTVAAAIPKGPRADWMIEKLSELGTSTFVPLITARSVVLPEGKGKRDRWARLAAESAKQSRRIGVMRIEELTDVRRLVGGLRQPGWYLSTSAGALPIGQALSNLTAPSRPLEGLTLLIGPEGGWTAEETEAFEQAGLTGVSLGGTILRIETAAIAAAAIMAGVLVPALADGGKQEP